MTAPTRKARSLVGVILLGLLTVLVAGVLYLNWPQIFAWLEEEAIRSERVSRWTLAKTGQTLPGTPDLQNLSGRLQEHGVDLGAPVFIRVFKREFELEVWLKRDGRFHRFATYPICMWSGWLGPKRKEGDRQSPEGFYTVDKTALNPNSKYHLSFNLGYPNAFDRAHGRTGSFLMVHGVCGSIGCYAMTNAVIDEIWELVTAALNSGQQRFQVQVFPYRMTDRNMGSHADYPDAPFWRQLKQGHDLFEAEFVPPKVSVCDGRYVFQSAASNTDGSAPITNSCPAESARN